MQTEDLMFATVGVTGHRILDETDKIRTAIHQALFETEKKFPGKSLRLLTQLADGSDRLVAEEFLNKERHRVTAVLPFPIEEYMHDFSADSKKQFLAMLRECDEIICMPSAPDRDAAYESAGLYIVDHSEVMICIWDGMAEQGRGGTGAIVEMARQKMLPIAWIHAGNRQPGTSNPTNLGEEQGNLTLINF